MDWLIVIIVIVIAIAIFYFLDKYAETTPNICPNCKKEVEKLERWSYTEYLWGLRCPYCKYEYDIDP